MLELLEDEHPVVHRNMPHGPQEIFNNAHCGT